jgi:hypothetical protein
MTLPPSTTTTTPITSTTTTPVTYTTTTPITSTTTRPSTTSQTTTQPTTSSTTTLLPTTTTTPYVCPASQVSGDLSKSSAASSATIYELVSNFKNNIGSNIFIGSNGFTPTTPGSSIYIDMPNTASSYVSCFYCLII